MNREDDIEERWRDDNIGRQDGDVVWLVNVARVARSMVDSRLHFAPDSKGDRGRSIVIHLRDVLEEKT